MVIFSLGCVFEIVTGNKVSQRVHIAHNRNVFLLDKFPPRKQR